MARLHQFRDTTAEEEIAWSEAFTKVAGPLAADAPGDQLPDDRAVRAAARRACSGWRSSTSTRRSRCSWSRCGPATSRTGSSRPGTGGSTRRRSPSTGRGSPARSSTAGSPRSWPSRSASRSPTPSRSAAARYKNLLLFLVIAPFFTSFLLRTISWKIILADDGILLGPLKTIGILPEEFQLLATPAAVIVGITYNFLPFMTLPLYVALEKIDRRLLEAAEDLYAGPWRPRGTIVGARRRRPARRRRRRGHGLRAARRSGSRARSSARVVGTWLVSQAFVRVTLPLALPGIFAGSLLTFIPAVGDYINAELLGNPQSLMIGNVIQARYLKVTDYPTASALSFILMAAILVGVLHLRPRCSAPRS